MASAPEDRFARLKTDPRFRRPKQKQLKVELDERFRDVLESEEFGGKGKGKGKASDVKVDKRGRPLAGSHHQDQLKRFYRLRSPSPSASGSADPNAAAEPTFIDYARGDGYLSSSGSEDDEEESEAEEEELEIGGKRRIKPRAEYDDSGSDSEDGSDASGSHLAIDLDEDEDEGQTAFPLEVIGEGDEEEEEEEEDDRPTTDPTTRFAAVNLDWDNLRAADLFAVFNSFIKEGGRKIKGAAEMKGEGKLLGVKIYPSEFGKERMKREEMEGPGGGMFISKKGEGKGKGIGRRSRRDESEEESDEEESGSEIDEEEGDSQIGSDDELELSQEEEGSDEDEDDDEEDEDEENEESDDGLPASGKANKLEVMSDVSSDAGSEDIDMDQLRQYQLERLRYYYAIVTFSSVAAAEHVFDECNGTEFERTANVFDLSYVPDGMDFSDDDLHDEATKEPRGYKGTDFVTDALRHSKVKLTWDQDDPNRSKLTRKAMTREEIEEQDFKNLVAGSDDSASDSEPESDDEAASGLPIGTGTGAGKTTKVKPTAGAADAKAKKAKVKERKDELRALLLAGNEEDGDIWGKAGLSQAADMDDDEEAEGKGGKAKGGMEITFRPALAEGAPALEDDNLTTLERYQLRMKEKKSRKKEKLEMKRGMKEGGAAGSDGEDAKGAPAKAGTEGDDFFGGDSDEEVVKLDPPKKGKKDAKSATSKPTKADAAPTIKAKVVPVPIPTTSAIPADVHADLQPGNDAEHFSMKDILRDEKAEGSKRRRKRASQAKKEARNEALGRTRETELGKEGWTIDVKDKRFKALHEEAEFAIDPSNPHFTKTKAMKDLLAERARVRGDKRQSDDTGAPVEPAPKKAAAAAGAGPKERDLSALVQSVKRKMESNGGDKAGKIGGGRKRHRK